MITSIKPSLLVLHACLGLSVLGPGLAPSASAQPQRRGLPAPKEIDLPPVPVALPMLRYQGLSIVEATINGAGPFRLVVDTGASGVVLDDRHSAALDLPVPPGMPAGAPGLRVMTPSGPAAAELKYIEELAIDAVRVRGIWTLAIDLPFGDAIDGVIGMDLFGSGLLTYDYPSGVFRVGQGALPEVDGREVFSYRSTNGAATHPHVDMTVGDETMEFFVDTGFRGWFGGSEAWVRERGLVAGPVEGMMGLSVGGSARGRIARVASSFALGPHVVHQPLVNVTSEAAGAQILDKAIVGISFLEHFVVTFDGTHNRMRLAHGPDRPLTAPSPRLLGVSMKQVGDEMEVWSIHPDSDAAALGLSVGDRVRTINGRPAVEMLGAPEWPETLRTVDTVALAYASGGTGPVRTVTVSVLELPLDAQRGS